MTDAVTKRDIERAQKVVELYAEGLDGLTQQECLDVGFSQKQCRAFLQALGQGKAGEITRQERNHLRQVGFHKKFIYEIAGQDGLKALKNRVRWLADHAVVMEKEFSNYTSDQQAKMIKELGQMGPLADECIPKLIKALKSKETFIYLEAIHALGAIVSSAIKDLMPLLDDGNPEIAMRAAQALDEIGPGAVSAIPKLMSLMEQYFDYLLPSRPARALAEVAFENSLVVPGLVAMLRHKEWWVRLNAASVLAEMVYSAAVPAIPLLEDMVRDDPDPDCQRYAQQTLDKLREQIP